MNFAEFSFWWSLAISASIFFIVRCIGQSLKIWTQYFDRIGLVLISLNIFWNAAPASCIIFILELIFNYLMIRLMQRQEIQKAKLIATITIIIDLSILIYFKYLAFFITDVLGIKYISDSTVEGGNIFSGIQQIPPGISFYTFEMVSFVVDSFKRVDKQKINFFDFINFTSFFPKLVAGPIERRSDFLPQMQSFRFKFSFEDTEVGLRWIVLGFFMKLVLSDNVAAFVNLEETENAWAIWLSIYSFGFRIYFDFAGYSFIAFGLARLLGIRLTLNFLAPYLSSSIQEFWRRWHVTLSTWFRDYIYLPLGGSRVPWAAFNLFTVFVISGLWHGAGWNFIFWGAYHGLLLVFHRYIGRNLSIPTVLAWFLTLASVMFGWLFFMETNTNQLMLKLQTLITPTAYSIANIKAAVATDIYLLVTVMTLVTAFLIGEFIAVIQKRECAYALFLSPWITRVLCALVILLAANRSSEFIYFAF